jgi:hypothetical protein
MISLPSCFNLEAVTPIFAARSSRWTRSCQRNKGALCSVPTRVLFRRPVLSPPAKLCCVVQPSGRWMVAEFLTIRRECNHSQSPVGAEGRTMIRANQATNVRFRTLENNCRTGRRSRLQAHLVRAHRPRVSLRIHGQPGGLMLVASAAVSERLSATVRLFSSSSRVGRDSIRRRARARNSVAHNKHRQQQHRGQQHRQQQHRRLPPHQGVPRDRRHRDKRLHDRRQHLFDNRLRRQLK